jgi:hypothetical protein
LLSLRPGSHQASEATTHQAADRATLNGGLCYALAEGPVGIINLGGNVLYECLKTRLGGLLRGFYERTTEESRGHFMTSFVNNERLDIFTSSASDSPHKYAAEQWCHTLGLGDQLVTCISFAKPLIYKSLVSRGLVLQLLMGHPFNLSGHASGNAAHGKRTF